MKNESQACRLLIPAAICYDFDGTLAPGCMMDYTFIPELSLTPDAFWHLSNDLARQKGMDPILAYMWCMQDELAGKGKRLTRDLLRQCGPSVPFFKGVADGWFQRISNYAQSKGVLLEHYIISSGLKEIAKGTVIAPHLKEIFASDYMYDADGNTVWPSLSVNYTNKTQFLFRINKGCLDLGDHKSINQHMDDKDKPMPFSHMIYIGDGETDVPSMKVVRQEGGYAVAVYAPDSVGAKERVAPLAYNQRVDLVAEADYREGKDIDVFVKAILDQIIATAHLETFKQTHDIYNNQLS